MYAKSIGFSSILSTEEEKKIIHNSDKTYKILEMNFTSYRTYLRETKKY